MGRLIAVLALALAWPGAPASAQLGQTLQGVLGGSGGAANEGGALGGLLPSVGRASPGNTAGVLQYCLRNNYLEHGPAASVGQALSGRLPRGGRDDTLFQAGNTGHLQTDDGRSYALGGSGVQAQVTRKLCGLVLQHAQSLL